MASSYLHYVIILIKHIYFVFIFTDGKGIGTNWYVESASLCTDCVFLLLVYCLLYVAPWYTLTRSSSSLSQYMLLLNHCLLYIDTFTSLLLLRVSNLVMNHILVPDIQSAMNALMVGRVWFIYINTSNIGSDRSGVSCFISLRTCWDKRWHCSLVHLSNPYRLSLAAVRVCVYVCVYTLFTHSSHIIIFSLFNFFF